MRIYWNLLYCRAFTNPVMRVNKAKKLCQDHAKWKVVNDLPVSISNSSQSCIEKLGALTNPPYSSNDWHCVNFPQVCVNWYPCGLKYCKGKPQGGLSYRCGIKTCRRCYRYHYYVRRRDACMAYTWQTHGPAWTHHLKYLLTFSDYFIGTCIWGWNSMQWELSNSNIYWC